MNEWMIVFCFVFSLRRNWCLHDMMFFSGISWLYWTAEVAGLWLGRAGNYSNFRSNCVRWGQANSESEFWIIGIAEICFATVPVPQCSLQQRRFLIWPMNGLCKLWFCALASLEFHTQGKSCFNIESWFTSMFCEQTKCSFYYSQHSAVSDISASLWLFGQQATALHCFDP